MRVISAVGARPKAMKIARLVAEMWKHSAMVPIPVHTGQHYAIASWTWASPDQVRIWALGLSCTENRRIAL
jgi:hypothetical protein